MKAFLKRRWILFSWAVVLLACTVIDMGFTWAFGWGSGRFCSYRGTLQLVTSHQPCTEGVKVIIGQIHLPQIGGLPGLPVYGAPPGSSFSIMADIPLWLPLSVVLGWIVFRELRWREKRAKSN